MNVEKFRTKAETAFNLKKNVWISINDSVRVLIQDSTSNSIRKSVLDKISYSIRDSVSNLIFSSLNNSTSDSILFLISRNLHNKFKKKI